MSYTNATFFLDPISGSDTARTALTTVTVANPSGSITRATKTAHGLVTGAVVDLTLFSAWLNEAWIISVVDANNFDLVGAVWQTTADNNGTATPRGGSSKADAWKTFNNGATAPRIAPGDTIRVIASTDPTSLGQTATWTKGSKTVTLTTAVTADISTCQAAWTASANVTTTTSSTRKEGTLSTSIAPNGTFTTGLAAYEAMTATDFSGYQQISFWIQSSVAVTAGQLQLKLCSDNAGATPVNTINIPAIPSALVGTLVPMVVDTGGALGASIQSVALYVATDFGAVTVLLDNVIACKASSSADSLTHQSLIGKIHNLNWAASTVYSVNDIRKPTTTNRNGYRYKVTSVSGTGTSGGSEPTWPQEVGVTVTDNAGANQVVWTCDSNEETWYPIQSIRGTTVSIDNYTGLSLSTSAGRGYHGTTESLTTYKREPLQLTAQSGSTTINGSFMDSGSIAGGQITFSGGWNRTDMTTQGAAGETWLAAQGSGAAYGFNTSGVSFVTANNLNAATVGFGFYLGDATAVGNRIVNCQVSGSVDALGITNSNTVTQVDLSGFVAANGFDCVSISSAANPLVITGRCVAIHSMLSNGMRVTPGGWYDLAHVEARNNSGGTLFAAASGTRPMLLRDIITSDNGTVFGALSADINVGTATIGETLAPTLNAYSNARLSFNNLNGAGAKIYTDSGTIAQATDQRNTASGYSWKFLPTSTTRAPDYPLKLSLPRLGCNANALVTVSIYVRRDNTNIKGRLMCKGGQIAGVGADAYTDCAPSINTWTQYTLTFTPTAAGIVEISFECYDGVGTSNSLWIDDFASSQA